MNMRHRARAVVALAAAYAVALQAILLAIGGPAAGAGQLAAVPICSSLGAGHSAPAGHGQARDCLGACLAACCCGTPVLPGSGAAMSYAPAPQQTVAAAIEATPLSVPGTTRAHRSRAPPFA
jgi:hypothetical protein